MIPTLIVVTRRMEKPGVKPNYDLQQFQKRDQLEHRQFVFVGDKRMVSMMTTTIITTTATRRTKSNERKTGDRCVVKSYDKVVTKIVGDDVRMGRGLP